MASFRVLHARVEYLENEVADMHVYLAFALAGLSFVCFYLAFHK